MLKNKASYLLSASLLLAATAAFAQFAGKSEMFLSSGSGIPSNAYFIQIPQSVTIQDTKDNRTWKGGDVIAIPGSLIDILTPPEAEAVMKTQAGFNSKNDFPTLAKYPDHVMVQLTVPPGFVISNSEGRKVTGPGSVTFVVESSKMTAKDMGNSYWEMRYHSPGFQGK